MSALLWCFYWDLGLEISLCLTCTTLTSFCDCCRKQSPGCGRMSILPSTRTSSQRMSGWKEERDRKLKEERSRSKDSVPKEDGKESTSSDCKLPRQRNPPRGQGAPAQCPRACVLLSPSTSPHPPYMPGFSHSQSYDPSHPSYRGMPTVMMQNYPVRHRSLLLWSLGGNKADFKSSFLAQLSC